jgi:O-methyltransferase
MRAASSNEPAPMMDAQAHLAGAREPRAAGAAADVGALRTAYLDLLKLCLCDLAGTSTVSVGAMADGTVMSRELRGDGLRLRAAGMDWPLQGLTMVGLGRLDDLQACVESVIADGVEGDLIEAGAWRGGASILMRATLDAVGDQRTVWVADSFAGFPEADAPDHGSLDLRDFDFLAAPLEDVRASFTRLGYEDGVRFVPGFFDADTYEATRLALRCLYRGLSVGGHLILDDYGSFEGCRRAVDEFRAEHAIAEPIEVVDSTCARWRRESAAPIEVAPVHAAPQPDAPRAAPPRPPAHVPSARELELAHEVAALRERLAAAEAQIGARAWLRRRLGRSAPR